MDKREDTSTLSPANFLKSIDASSRSVEKRLGDHDLDMILHNNPNSNIEDNQISVHLGQQQQQSDNLINNGAVDAGLDHPIGEKPVNMVQSSAKKAGGFDDSLNSRRPSTNVNDKQLGRRGSENLQEVRQMLEFLFLDVKVRSPAEIAELTDVKLAEERAALGRVRTTTLIKDIRTSIELLLSIKNDQQTTQNQDEILENPPASYMHTGQTLNDGLDPVTNSSILHMEKSNSVKSLQLIKNDKGSQFLAKRNKLEKSQGVDKQKRGKKIIGQEPLIQVSVGEHSISPSERSDRSGNEGEILVSGDTDPHLIQKESKSRNGSTLMEEKALTEFGSSYDPGASQNTTSVHHQDRFGALGTESDISMNTQQNCVALEQQMVKYEADIRKHISIEHQLQLFADDLKRSVHVLEKEKEVLEEKLEKQDQELSDLAELRQEVEKSQKAYKESENMSQTLKRQLLEVESQLSTQKQIYEKHLAEQKSQIIKLQIKASSAQVSKKAQKAQSKDCGAQTDDSESFGGLNSSELFSCQGLTSTKNGKIVVPAQNVTTSVSASRQSSKKQSNSSNRIGSQQFLVTTGQIKTPLAAQLSTGVTSGSQKQNYLKQSNQNNIGQTSAQNNFSGLKSSTQFLQRDSSFGATSHLKSQTSLPKKDDKTSQQREGISSRSTGGTFVAQKGALNSSSASRIHASSSSQLQNSKQPTTSHIKRQSNPSVITNANLNNNNLSAIENNGNSRVENTSSLQHSQGKMKQQVPSADFHLSTYLNDQSRKSRDILAASQTIKNHNHNQSGGGNNNTASLQRVTGGASQNANQSSSNILYTKNTNAAQAQQALSSSATRGNLQQNQLSSSFAKQSSLTAGISPIKTSRKIGHQTKQIVHHQQSQNQNQHQIIHSHQNINNSHILNNNNNSSNQNLLQKQKQQQMGSHKNGVGSSTISGGGGQLAEKASKHSRSFAHLDVSKISSLTAQRRQGQGQLENQDQSPGQKQQIKKEVPPQTVVANHHQRQVKKAQQKVVVQQSSSNATENANHIQMVHNNGGTFQVQQLQKTTNQQQEMLENTRGKTSSASQVLYQRLVNEQEKSASQQIVSSSNHKNLKSKNQRSEPNSAATLVEPQTLAAYHQHEMVLQSVQNSHPTSSGAAPENIAEMSHGSIKMLKVVDANLNKASGNIGKSVVVSHSKMSQIHQQNAGGRLSENNFGSSHQNMNQNPQKAYIVPTHRRSNTAASFMPTMSLKQLADPKGAAQLYTGLQQTRQDNLVGPSQRTKSNSSSTHHHQHMPIQGKQNALHSFDQRTVVERGCGASRDLTNSQTKTQSQNRTGMLNMTHQNTSKYHPSASVAASTAEMQSTQTKMVHQQQQAQNKSQYSNKNNSSVTGRFQGLNNSAQKRQNFMMQQAAGQTTSNDDIRIQNNVIVNGFLQGGVLKLEKNTNSEDVVDDEIRQKMRMSDKLSKSNNLQNGSLNRESNSRPPNANISSARKTTLTTNHQNNGNRNSANNFDQGPNRQHSQSMQLQKSQNRILTQKFDGMYTKNNEELSQAALGESKAKLIATAAQQMQQNAVHQSFLKNAPVHKITKNIVAKQQKLMRNQIFKSSDFVQQAQPQNNVQRQSEMSKRNQVNINAAGGQQSRV